MHYRFTVTGSAEKKTDKIWNQVHTIYAISDEAVQIYRFAPHDFAPFRTFEQIIRKGEFDNKCEHINTSFEFIQSRSSSKVEIKIFKTNENNSDIQ